jgi:predicted TIM-barrel fold metal-dependent hydrolase
MAPVGETQKVAAIAEACERSGCAARVAAGIVAFADLTLGRDVAAVLDAHEQAAGGRLRGARHSVSRDPHYPEGIVLRPAPEGLLADPAYREGLRTLAARGLSYDAMLYHAQIPELAAMARAIPDLSIVCDHMGTLLGVGPYAERPQEAFAAWRQSMAELASCPNVTVKIGGFGMIICGAEWHLRPDPPGSDELALDWKDRFETCVELFGAERCMFESNFPVDKAMASYRTVWNAFKQLTTGASADEKAALFSRTAARVYRLDAALSGG